MYQAAHLEALFADLPVAVAVLDRNFTYLRANPAYLRAVGRQPGELIGQNHFAIFPDAALREVFQDVLRSGKPHQGEPDALPFPALGSQARPGWQWTLQSLKLENGGSPAPGLLLTLVPAVHAAQEDAPAGESRKGPEAREAAGSARANDSDARASASDARARHSEAQLHQTQVMYQHLFESTPDANVMVNESGIIVAVNHQAEELFGYEQKEMVGRPVDLLIPEAVREKHSALHAAFMRSPVPRPMAADQALRLELQARRKGGSIFPTEITLNPVKIGSGLFVLCVVRDATQREQRERELSRQYGLVRLLQDIAVASNEATSLNGAFHYALTRINRYLGWTLGHAYLVDDDGLITSTSIWTDTNSVPADAADAAAKPAARSRMEPVLSIPHTGLRDGVPHRAKPNRAAGRFGVFKAVSEALRFHNDLGKSVTILNDGLPIWLNNLPENPHFARGREARQAGLRTSLAIPVMAGKKLVGVLEFFHSQDLPPDPSLMAVLPHIGVQVGRVVERHRSEEALRKAAAQLRMVMTNLPVFLWVSDREGSLLMIEGREIEQFQSTPQILPGKNLFKLFDTRPDLLDHIRRALVGEEIHTEVRGKNGAVFEAYLMPYYDVNWAVDGVIGLTFNISERKRMETELDEMRHRLLDSADNERTRLASQLHDGPLQDLYGAYYQIQEIKNSLDETGQQTVDRALQTIQSVNATLRVICGELHPSTLVHLGVEKAIRSHAGRLQERLETINLHLELENDAVDLPHAMRLGLYRTYQQLVNNAVQHSAASDIWVRLRFEPRRVVLEVQDNGQGFENPTHWVELVRQGKLGLVSALERAQGLNGKLQIDTSPGQGTLVRVLLPIE